jgi:hypothetical protein
VVRDWASKDQKRSGRMEMCRHEKVECDYAEQGRTAYAPQSAVELKIQPVSALVTSKADSASHG